VGHDRGSERRIGEDSRGKEEAGCRAGSNFGPTREGTRWNDSKSVPTSSRSAIPSRAKIFESHLDRGTGSGGIPESSDALATHGSANRDSERSSLSRQVYARDHQKPVEGANGQTSEWKSDPVGGSLHHLGQSSYTYNLGYAYLHNTGSSFRYSTHTTVNTASYDARVLFHDHCTSNCLCREETLTNFKEERLENLPLISDLIKRVQTLESIQQYV
jgi:hypothetical protein